MKRSRWKGPFYSKNILKNCQKSIKIYSRCSVIPLKLVNKTIFIYNGKTFIKTLITRGKVGYKFGSFVTTRVYAKKNRQKNLVRKSYQRKKQKKLQQKLKLNLGKKK